VISRISYAVMVVSGVLSGAILVLSLRG